MVTMTPTVLASSFRVDLAETSFDDLRIMVEMIPADASNEGHVAVFRRERDPNHFFAQVSDLSRDTFGETWAADDFPAAMTRPRSSSLEPAWLVEIREGGEGHLMQCIFETSDEAAACLWRWATDQFDWSGLWVRKATPA